MKLNVERMIEKIQITLFIVLISSGLKAQDPKKYDEIFRKTFVETSHINFEKSLEVADSLFQVSETPYFQTKSLMLSASLYGQVGELKKSIKYAEKAGGIIDKTDDFNWKARVEGFLATQYRMLSIYSLSEIHANRAINAAEKIKDKKTSQLTLALLMQEKAFSENSRGNYKEALELFEETGKYFDDLDDNYMIAQNDQFKGHCALNLGMYDTALFYFHNALFKWGELPDNYIKGLIYIGFSEVYIHYNKLDLAKENLDKAREIAVESSYLEFLNKFYATEFTYYSLIANMDKLKESRVKKDSIQLLLSAERSKYLDQSISDLNTKNIQIGNQKLKREYVILGAGLFFLMGLIYFLYYRKEQKRQVQKFKSILEELKKSKELNPDSNEELQSVDRKDDIIQEEQEKPLETSIMSPEVEERILVQLKKFEKSGLFTKNSISLSSLASYCKTNTKYLSHCINKHKGMDYNNYVNNLRVNFIIDKLVNEPIYRKYKFSTLAEEAGFSSQNKFSTVFKKSTTISPSTFIKELEKELEEYF
jgi:AraC-like DNA-binding protein